MQVPKLNPVDKVEILTLIDNTVDMLLASSDRVKRPPLGNDTFAQEPLVAEHGYSALIRVTVGDTTQTVLLDAGLSRDGVVKNLDTLKVDLNSIQTIVLSHGHTDHTKGLSRLIEHLPNNNIKLYSHPHAFLNRKLVLPNGNEIRLPPVNKHDLLDAGVQIIENDGISTILGSNVMITGDIPRLTEFEKGFPAHQSEIDGKWCQDCDIHDDQAIVLRIKNKGLVILTGCGHAGIINTVKYAQKSTGIQEVNAIMGGFHLSGPQFQPIVPLTVKALQEINPTTIVPGHCTGWQAITAISQAMPEAYIPNSVGSRFIFE